MHAPAFRAARTCGSFPSTIVLIVGLAASVTGASAQETRAPLVTDRPDQTESTAVVPRGAFQLEAGATWSQLSGGHPRARTLEVPGALLRIGIVNHLEARIGFAGWQSLSIREGGVRDLDESGIGDTEVGFKFRLAPENGIAPAIAILGSLVLPTGDENFGAARVDPALRFAFSHALTDRLGLGYNLSFEQRSVRGENGRTESSLASGYTVSLGVGVSERTGAFIELFGEFLPAFNGPQEHLFDGGLTFLLSPLFQLDVAGGVGLRSAAPDWFFGAGASVRLPR